MNKYKITMAIGSQLYYETVEAFSSEQAAYIIGNAYGPNKRELLKIEEIKERYEVIKTYSNIFQIWDKEIKNYICACSLENSALYIARLLERDHNQ